MKNTEEDPDKKWIATWNDNLHRIKHLFGGSTIMTNFDACSSGMNIVFGQTSCPRCGIIYVPRLQQKFSV